MAKPAGKAGGEGSERRALPLLLSCLLAVSLLLGLVVYEKNGREEGKVELLDDGRAMELLRTLASRHRERGEGDMAMDGKVRNALMDLESSLSDELKNVRGVLKQLGNASPDARNQRLKDTDGSKESAHAKHSDSDQAWSKRTMQRGAMRGESVEKQLRKVLARELEKDLTKKTEWKSAKELKAAMSFADYLKKNPLPEAEANARAEDKTSSDVEGPAWSHSRDDDGGVIVKVEFKRGSMPQSEFDDIKRDLEKAAEDEREEEGQDGLADTGKSGVAGTARKAISGRPDRTEEEDERGSRGEPAQRLSDAGRGGERRHERGSGGEARADQERFNGMEGRTEYQVQEGDKAAGEALVKGRAWAARETLREHGDFVHLPSTRQPLLPLAVRPYWDESLPRGK